MIYVSEFFLAREGMLHAYDEGMTNGDYVFIMFELDQSQVSLFYQQPFKWFFSSYPSTLKRFQHLQTAFHAAFVLAIKSPSSHNYSLFKNEIKRRATEPPFYSKVYTGYLWDKNEKFPANKTEVRKIQFRRRTFHVFTFHISCVHFSVFRCNLCYADLCHARAIFHKRKKILNTRIQN